MGNKGIVKFGIINVKNDTVLKHEGITGKVTFLSPGKHFVNGRVVTYNMEKQEMHINNVAIKNRLGQTLIFDLKIESKIAGGLKYNDYDGFSYRNSIDNNYDSVNPADGRKWWNDNNAIKTYEKYERDFLEDERNEALGLYTKAGLTRSIIEECLQSVFENTSFETFNGIAHDDAKIIELYSKVRKELLEKGKQLVELNFERVKMYQDHIEVKQDLGIVINDYDYTILTDSKNIPAKEVEEEPEKVLKKEYHLVRKGNKTVIKIDKDNASDGFIVDYASIEDEEPKDEHTKSSDIIKQNKESIESMIVNAPEATDKVSSEDEVIGDHGYVEIDQNKINSEEAIAGNKKFLETRISNLKNDEVVVPEQTVEDVVVDDELTELSYDAVIAYLAEQYDLSINELIDGLDKIKSKNLDDKTEKEEFDKLIKEKDAEIDKLVAKLSKKINENKKLKEMGVKAINEISAEYEQEINDVKEADEKKYQEALTKQERKYKRIIRDYEEEIDLSVRDEIVDEIKSIKDKFIAIPAFVAGKLSRKKSDNTGVNTLLLNNYDTEEVSEELNANIDDASKKLLDEINELKKQLVEKDNEINGLKTMLDDQVADNNKLGDTIKEKDNEINDLKLTLDDKDREINRSVMVNEEISRKNSELSRDVDSLKSNNSFLNNEITSLKDDLNKKDEEILGLEKELSDKCNEISSLLTNNESLIEENDSIKEANKTLVVENAKIKEDNESLIEENEKLIKENSKQTISNLKITNITLERIILIEVNGETKKYRININGELKYNGAFEEEKVINKMIYNNIKTKFSKGNIKVLDYDYGKKMTLVKDNLELTNNKTK